MYEQEASAEARGLNNLAVKRGCRAEAFGTEMSAPEDGHPTCTLVACMLIRIYVFGNGRGRSFAKID